MQILDAVLNISIHALREEGDSHSPIQILVTRYFYPRPPRGGRRAPNLPAAGVLQNFYPRPPRGGRPGGRHGRPNIRMISIHALREEGDTRRPPRWQSKSKFLSTPSARRATMPPPSPCGQGWHFYPRPPRGGRRAYGLGLRYEGDISIHALREEGDGPMASACAMKATFLSTPSARRATGRLVRGRQRHGISIHALREEGDC